MPIRMPLRGVFLLLGLFLLRLAPAQPFLTLVGRQAQDSVVVLGHLGDPELAPVALRAEWTEMDAGKGGARFQLHWLRQPGEGQQVELVELIMAGVDQYLDQRIHFTRDGVRTSLPPGRIMDGVERIANATAAFTGRGSIVFSEATRKQLNRVCSIDWSQARFGVDGGEDQEKYMAIYYYVRVQRQELERNLRNDLSPLFGLRLGPAHAAWDEPGRQLAVPTVCSTVFDEENYLCALDLRADSSMALQDVRLTDAMLQDIARAAEADAGQVPAPRLRKRDRWLKAELDAINRRIDQGDQRKELWALRDRMDDMEDRLNDLDMRLDEMTHDQEARGRTENPVAGLSTLTGRNVEVRFGVGSAELGVRQKALLDEVVKAMAMAPGERVLVTGYADPSGDPGHNLILSEMRAKAVRGYLLAQGISGQRVLLNYSGAVKGAAGSAAERRVELEWIR